MTSKFVHYIPFAVFTFLVLGLSTYDFIGVPFLPGLAFVWIFHWTLYRPNQVFALPLVLLGAIYDLLMDNPMGLTPLVFLSSYLGLLYLRAQVYSLPFRLIWVAFTFFAMLCTLLYVTVFCVLTFSWVVPSGLIYSFLWVILFYPLLCRMMIFIQRRTNV